MTREEKYTISNAKRIVSRLDSVTDIPDDVKYLEALYEQLTNFFKSRFNNQWQFDVWRNRYVD